MKHLLHLIVIGFSAAALAAAPDGSKAGRVVRPGSPKGVFTFFNAQDVISTNEIAKVVKILEHDLKIKFEIVNTKPADPAALVKTAPSKIGVVIVSDAATPSYLVAPDDGWGVVNVRALDKFNSPAAREKFLGERFRRQLARAFCGVAGGFCSTYPGNCASVLSLEELEMVPEGVPNDKIITAQRYLKSRGFSPVILVPYRKACQEGWAPAPTNAAQKAIWDQVRAIPKNPMKIEFDPKKGR